MARRQGRRPPPGAPSRLHSYHSPDPGLHFPRPPPRGRCFTGRNSASRRPGLRASPGRGPIADAGPGRGPGSSANPVPCRHLPEDLLTSRQVERDPEMLVRLLKPRPLEGDAQEDVHLGRSRVVHHQALQLHPRRGIRPACRSWITLRTADCRSGGILRAVAVTGRTTSRMAVIAIRLIFQHRRRPRNRWRSSASAPASG